MKNLFLVLLLSVLSGVNAVADGGSQEIQASAQRPKQVFVPQGFDDNDNVVVVLSGVFNNFCYKIAPTAMRVDLESRKIYLDNQIYAIGNCHNAFLYIPYSNNINLGILPQGQYEILASDGKGGYEARATFPVGPAKPSIYGPDSALYAPIKELQFVPNHRDAKNPKVVLKGTFTNNCMAIDKIEVQQSANGMVEILPIAKVLDRSNCRARPVPFERTVTLKNFPSGEVLIHVRTLGGQAINRVITFIDRFDVRF